MAKLPAALLLLVLIGPVSAAVPPVQLNVLKEGGIHKTFQARLAQFDWAIQNVDALIAKGEVFRRPQRDRLAAERAEMAAVIASFEKSGDELAWLREHAKPLSPLQTELYREVARLVPGMDASRTFLADKTGPLNQLLDSVGRSIYGATFPVASSSGGGAVVLRDTLGPDAAPELQDAAASLTERAAGIAAAARFENDMRAVVTALHEAFHQSHAIADSIKTLRRLGGGRDAQDALQSVIEEGYTHGQTRAAIPELLQGVAGGGVGAELRTAWSDHAARDAGALEAANGMLERFDAYLSGHHYQRYTDLVAAMGRRAGDEPVDALIAGDVRPLIASMGKDSLRSLSRLCLLYMADGRRGMRALLFEEMRSAASGTSSPKRVKTVIAIHHFVGRFYDRHSAEAVPTTLRRFPGFMNEISDELLSGEDARAAWDSWIARFEREPAKVFQEMDERARIEAGAAVAFRLKPR